jgi:hypothetical protein
LGGSVVAEEFGVVVDEAVVIDVADEEAIVCFDPACGFAEAVAIDIEVGLAGGEVGEFDAVVVEVED